MGPIIPEKFDYIDHWKTINPIEHMVFKHISMCLKMTAKKCVFFFIGKHGASLSLLTGASSRDLSHLRRAPLVG
jgi:hypothetical protein